MYTHLWLRVVYSSLGGLSKVLVEKRCYDVRGEGVLVHDVLQLHCQQTLSLCILVVEQV